jgi:hypothetical protein
MKENLRKLALISRGIDLSLFYCITVYEDDINFQGKFNRTLMTYLKSHFFTIETGSNGFVYARKSNIKVVLT